MAGRPPIADADGGTGMSAPEFELALRRATTFMESQGFGPGTALIPDLRRALGRRVSRREFNEGLRRLREEGSVGLQPHAHPELLNPFEIEDALPEGPTLLYLLRWLK